MHGRKEGKRLQYYIIVLTVIFMERTIPAIFFPFALSYWMFILAYEEKLNIASKEVFANTSQHFVPSFSRYMYSTDCCLGSNFCWPNSSLTVYNCLTFLIYIYNPIDLFLWFAAVKLNVGAELFDLQKDKHCQTRTTIFANNTMLL